MTILDAYALVALLGDEPAAAEIEQLLRLDDCGVTVINLAEAVDVARRIHGVEVHVSMGFIEPVLGNEIALLAHSVADARRAAELRSGYPGGADGALSLADCFLLAAAGPGDRVATPDPPVARVARAEGIELVALPDRTGKRP